VPALRPGVLECGPHQFTGDAAPANGVGHAGVGNDHALALQVIDELRLDAIHGGAEFVGLGVVLDGVRGHAIGHAWDVVAGLQVAGLHRLSRLPWLCRSWLLMLPWIACMRLSPACSSSAFAAAPSDWYPGPGTCP